MQNDNDRFQETADSADIEQVIDRGNGQTNEIPWLRMAVDKFIKINKALYFPNQESDCP